MPNEAEIQDLKIKKRMALVDRKILVMSGKGGVGKTTVTVNLAKALVKQGYKVGILDTDIHGPNVAKMLGCENYILTSNEDGSEIEPVVPMANLKVVSLSFAISDPEQAIIFRGPMKLGVIKQFLADVNWGTLDYLLIDSPPGTGDEQLAVCQNVPDLTGAIIVTTPQSVSVLDSRRSITFARQLNAKVLGIIENMSSFICPNCKDKHYIFGKDGGKNLAMEAKVPFLGEIPVEGTLQETTLKEGSEVEKAFNDIAEYIHKSVTFVHSPFDENPSSSCSPSACASCSLNCPSKKA